GHARVPEGEGPDPLGAQGREAPRHRRADEEALDHRARRLRDGAGEGRGRRRHPDAPEGAEGQEGSQAARPSRGRARGRRRRTRGGRGAGGGRRRARARERGLELLSWLANAWRVPELRRRVLFTAAVLAAYRLGSWIPAPGVNASAISGLFGGGVLGLLSLFSGGALSRFSIFALGIMPYVTASIVFQLLTVAGPSLEQPKRDGESGHAKVTQCPR